MRKQLFAAGMALALGMGYSLGAYAQARPETLVKQRQAAMTLQGKYPFSLNPMAQGKVPYDAAVFARNAAYLDVLTKLAWDGFTPATASVQSGALPAVFSEPDKFKAASDRLQVEVGKFVAATKGGNEATVKSTFGDVVKASIACHDSYQVKR